MTPRCNPRTVLSIILACASSSAMAQTPNAPTFLTVQGGVSLPPPGDALFSDNFEYDVLRTATNAGQLFGQRWYGAKAINSGEAGAGGYLYTRTDSVLGSRVLVLESLPTLNPVPGWPYGQTDYYLQLGRESGPAVIPANAWIQFWTYATPQSRFAPRDKTLYVCRTTYPCTTGNWTWMLLWGRVGSQYFLSEAEYAPLPNRFLALQTEGGSNRNAPEFPDGQESLYQNVSAAQIVGGRWYQVRLHIDTSGPQGTYEAWIKERGASGWTSVAEWIGGVTPNFTWPIPTNHRNGHPMMRLPTTVNGNYGDSTTYMDDFVVSDSLADLPN